MELKAENIDPVKTTAEILELIQQMNLQDSFKVGSEQYDHLLCLYHRIIEVSNDCVALLSAKNSKQSSSFILLRTLLEAMADFVLLANDPNYIFRLQANYHKENIKAVNLALEDKQNPFYEGVDWKALEVQQNEAKLQLEKLKENGYQPINEFEKIEKISTMSADGNNQFVVYRILSGEAHNNIAVLKARYIDNKSNNSMLIISSLVVVLSNVLKSFQHLFPTLSITNLPKIEQLCDQIKLIQP